MHAWQLQDAKSRFSELVECALSEGQQLVTWRQRRRGTAGGTRIPKARRRGCFGFTAAEGSTRRAAGHDPVTRAGAAAESGVIASEIPAGHLLAV